jgi:pantoate--beta-alanine ligase
MNLLTVRTVAEVRKRLAEARLEKLTIGLVPTMGALHAGHASLIERARAEAGSVVVSIFVNPLQFGPNEDYLRYPRPLEKDLDVCERKGANLVFVPEVADIYDSPQRTFVHVERLGDHLCGPVRPGHFRGVTTVVAKLFNIVQPDKAYFGEKDFQQLCIIRRMVKDLNMPVEIVAVPILRDADGLALSSRNVYLSTEERAVAPALYRALCFAKEIIEAGQRNPEIAKGDAMTVLIAEVPNSLLRIDYIEIVDIVDLQPVSEITGEVRIAAAIWIGKTRLIDNVAAVAR